MKNNEQQLARMVLLLADTQGWLNELCLQTMDGLYPPGRKLLKGRQYRLPVTAFAHILERHWHQVLRHPGTGKFCLGIAELLELIKLAEARPMHPVPGSVNYMRLYESGETIGVDREGLPCKMMTVITDPMGNIITAFPGIIQTGLAGGIL